MASEPMTEELANLITTGMVGPLGTLLSWNEAHVVASQIAGRLIALGYTTRATALADAAKRVEGLDATAEPSCGDCGAEIAMHTDCPEGDGHLVWEPSIIPAVLAILREGVTE